MHFWHNLGRRLSGNSVPRYMYDGINSDASAISRAFPGTQMVAGYVDGTYAWSQADWDLFPHAFHLYVAVSSSLNFGDVIDCETGDATPDQAAAWVRIRKAAGYDRPTVYCNASVAPAVRNATGTLLLGRDYDMWIADWTGHPFEYVFSDGRKAAATQFATSSFYDESSVYDPEWPHRTGSSAQGPYRNVVDSKTKLSLQGLAQSRGMDVPGFIAEQGRFVGAKVLSPQHYQVLLDFQKTENDCAIANVQRPLLSIGTVYYTMNS